MKRKNFRKHLTLNKKTIANLNSGEMTVIHGGGDSLGTLCCDPSAKSYCECPTDPTLECPTTSLDTCYSACWCLTVGPGCS